VAAVVVCVGLAVVFAGAMVQVVEGAIMVHQDSHLASADV